MLLLNQSANRLVQISAEDKRHFQELQSGKRRKCYKFVSAREMREKQLLLLLRYLFIRLRKPGEQRRACYFKGSISWPLLPSSANGQLASELF